MGVLRILLLLTMVWAALALAAQVVIARGGGRRDFSRPAARPIAGLFYNFTTAMLPGHKETAHLHPAEFAAGVVLHVGIFAALFEILSFLIPVNVGVVLFAGLRVLAGLGALTAMILIVRRVRSPLMCALSTPDDYLAALVTCGLLVLAAFPGLGSGAVLPGYAVLLFAYLPLGKLRHAVFFFVARADYGWRLGYRGVYPPARVETE